ncbi:MAG: nucleotidyltransferase domain-containing protein [bacterium]|nr:nucleotidyltransferase domain-containing protein [bacterium]
MAKEKIEKIIGYLKNLLENSGFEIDKIILFGSYARGNYRGDSDIDIVIISKSFSGKGIFERARMLGDIEWKLMDKFLIPLDIITMSPEDFKKGVSPISQYAKGGEIIYER